MCVGIILKGGEHLQTIREIERHFRVDISKYGWYYGRCKLLLDCCTCQIDLERFFIETKLVGKFTYDCGEWYEN